MPDPGGDVGPGRRKSVGMRDVKSRLRFQIEKAVGFLAGVLGDVVFLDIETTGLDEHEHRIVEIGAVRVRGGRVSEYHRLVNPETEVSMRIFDLCRGLTREDLESAPVLGQVRESFLDFIGGLPLVCHNADFEKRFLRAHVDRRLANTFLDSCELACILEPQLTNHNLDYLIKNLLGEERDEAHRALQDARDTKRVVEALLARLQAEGAEFLDFGLNYLRDTDWPWLSYLRRITVRPAPAPAEPESESEPARKAVLSPATPRFENCEEILRDEDFWRTHLPDYRFRPYQHDIVRELRRAFAEEKVFCLEAPTGSGKTLAYLLVAALWAAHREEAVFISTNTKNLQQQIVDVELPRLLAVLGLRLPYTTMKGMNNYVCRRKIREWVRETGGETDTDARLALLYLYHWSRRSGTGELEELSYWFARRYPVLERYKSLVRCDRADCEGTECREYGQCVYWNKRRRLGEASLVIVNHSLLVTWPPDYPELRHLIIDEAHSIEEQAFQGATREVTGGEVRLLLRKCHDPKNERGALLHLIHHHGRLHGKERSAPFYGRAATLVEEVGVLSQRITDVFSRIVASVEDHDARYDYRGAVPQNRDGLWVDLETAARNLAGRLDELAALTVSVLEEVAEKDAGFAEKVLGRQCAHLVKSLRRHAEGLRECFDQPDAGRCYYAGFNQESGRWSIGQTPAEVAETFCEHLLKKLRTCVLVSATLAQRGRFDTLYAALGITGLPAERLQPGRIIDHVYDYANRCVLAVPNDVARYSDRKKFIQDTARVVVGAARLLGGRTMVLFGSVERMKAVYDLVRKPLEKCGILVHARGETISNPRKLVEIMKADRHTVVLGSKTFWEGVDVPGPALSCVIIEKVPFPHMGDPLYRKREEELRKRGLNAFTHLSYPGASVLLRQQFGRLLRSSDDRGYVIVLDQLDGEQPYVNDLIGDLPPAGLLRAGVEEILQRMRTDFSNWGYPVYED